MRTLVPLARNAFMRDELALAALAELQLAGLDEGVFLRAATRAKDFAIGPAQFDSIGKNLQPLRSSRSLLHLDTQRLHQRLSFPESER